jgi:hypothetical protein
MATSPLAGGGAADRLFSLRALAPITAAPVAREPRKKERRFLNCFELRIPTKKIAHSELMTIRSSPSDAVKNIVEQVIVMVKN